MHNWISSRDLRPCRFPRSPLRGVSVPTRFGCATVPREVGLAEPLFRLAGQPLVVAESFVPLQLFSRSQFGDVWLQLGLRALAGWLLVAFTAPVPQVGTEPNSKWRFEAERGYHSIASDLLEMTTCSASLRFQSSELGQHRIRRSRIQALHCSPRTKKEIESGR